MENAGILFKNRSYSSCVHEGLKLGVQNFLTLLRNIWPTMTFAALLTAAASLFIGDFLPVLVSTTGRTDWSLLMFGVFSLIKLVMLLAGSAYLAHVTLLVKKYDELQFVPVLSWKNTWPELKMLWSRSFLWLFSFWLISFGLFVAFRNIAGSAWWTYFLDLVVLLGFSIPYFFVGTSYLFGKSSPAETLKAFPQAYRTWGATAAILLVSGLIAMIILLVCWLPSAILLSAEVFSYQNILAGDPTDLPAGFPILKFVMLFFTVILSGIAMWALIFPMIFHYASVRYRSEEKENLKKNSETTDSYPEWA